MKVIVERYRIITTGHVKYHVIEPVSGHTAIHQGGRYGEVMSRPVPERMRKLPAGMERYAAVKNWYDELKAFCMVAIFKAYPHLHNTANKIYSEDGTISEWWPNEADAILSFEHLAGAVEVDVDEVTVSE